jgi:hypothetical protein
MTASVMCPLFAMGGWGQGATTPVSASEVVISAAGAVIVGLLCALAGRRQSRPRSSRLASGAWIMLLALTLATPGAWAAPEDTPPRARDRGDSGVGFRMDLDFGKTAGLVAA